LLMMPVVGTPLHANATWERIATFFVNLNAPTRPPQRGSYASANLTGSVERVRPAV